MKRIVFSIVLTVMCILISDAQNIVLNSNRDSVLLGNTVTITLSLEDLDLEASIDDFSGLPVISGPNISQSTTIMNGEMSSRKSLSYVLMPDAPGEYSIGPIQINGDQPYTSNSITIKVLDNPDGIIQEDPNTMFFQFGNGQNPFSGFNASPFFDFNMSDYFNQIMPPQFEQPKEEVKKPKRKMKRL